MCWARTEPNWLRPTCRLRDITADCPAGTVVTGTGWELDGGAGQILVESVIPTSDSVTVSGYDVDAGPSGQYLLPWEVRAYATCVTEPDG